MRTPTANSDEPVWVIGPVDPTPGKKRIYKPRQIPRGLAESKAVRKLGIEILPHYDPNGEDGAGIEVENRTEQRRGRKTNVEKENEQLRKELAEMKEQLNAKANADQA